MPNLNTTDILSMMISPIVENYWLGLLLMIIGGFMWYILRFDMTDTYRQRKRHTADAVKWIAFPSVILIAYLFIHEHYWILSFLIAGMTYILLDYLNLLPDSLSLKKELF